jgi:hypothetical protein
MSKLGDYLKNHKIDARRVISASKTLERQTAADKALVAKKALMKAGKLEKDAELMKQKPHSGRPVTAPMIARAVGGQTVPGPVKTRIVRAVNALLGAKKKPEAKLADLF